MNNCVKQTQLCLLIVIVMSGGKYLSLPGILASFAGRDSWISMSLLFAVDFLCLVAILFAMKNCGGKSFYEILCMTLSTPVAKVLMTLYALFFTLRITGGLVDTVDLMSTSLSVVTNWAAFILPVLLVIGYNVAKGLKNTVRVTQIFFVFILVSVLLIILLSVKYTDLTELNPVLSEGFKPALDGSVNMSFWFSDCLFLFFCFGNVSVGKRFFTPFIVSFLVGAVLTVMLEITFLCLFGELAPYAQNALVKVSGFNIAGTSYGRLDWIFVIIWLSSIILKSTLYFWAATVALDKAFSINSNKGHVICFAAVALLVLVAPLILPVQQMISDLFILGAGKYVTMFLQYAVPILSPLLVFAANKKHGGEKSIRRVSEVKEQ